MFQSFGWMKPSVLLEIGWSKESPPHWFTPQCNRPSNPNARTIQNNARLSASGLSKRQSWYGLYLLQ